MPHTACLVVAATHVAASRTLGTGLLGFVVPLTAVPLLVTVRRALRRPHPSG